MSRPLLIIGALNGFLVVALGAFGAHALRNRIPPDMYTLFQTSVEYQSIHALALLAIGILALHLRSRLLLWSGWLISAGIVLFCGSLYLIAFTGDRSLAMLTPFGGGALLAGWLALSVAVWRQQ